MPSKAKYGLYVFGAIVAGIVIYSWLTKKSIPAILAGLPVIGNQIIGPTGEALFYGPGVDPITGAYLNPGATAGTVGFSTQPVGVQ